MDFAFFEGLSRDQAQDFLRSFLREERTAVRLMLDAAHREADIRDDFTIESASRVLRWAAQKLKIVPKTPDPSQPTWIRQTDSYAHAMLGLDDPSNILTLRCAFYLGESFVKSYSGLKWSVGDPEIAEQNQPVITGFTGGGEMSPLLVCQNLFLRVAVDGASLDHIGRAVAFWGAKAPSQ